MFFQKELYVLLEVLENFGTSIKNYCRCRGKLFLTVWLTHNVPACMIRCKHSHEIVLCENRQTPIGENCNDKES